MIETELALALRSTVPEAQAVMYSPTVCGCGGRGSQIGPPAPRGKVLPVGGVGFARVGGTVAST